MQNEMRVAISSASDIVTARQKGRKLGMELGFDGSDLTLIATAISEVARNIVDHAKCGEIILAPIQQGNRHGILLAVAAEVGHGGEAVAAARAAVAILEQFAPESIISLVKRCHQALTKTRGVVMTLAALSALEQTVTWLGVGNVEGRLLRSD